MADELPDEAIVPVSEAVLRDLAQWPADVVVTTDAAIAIALAHKLDRGGEISVAPVAKELAAVMDRLRSAAQARQARGDGVDDLTAARAVRRATASTSEPGSTGRHGGA